MNENFNCPSKDFFTFIGKKWNLLIIKSITDGCMCFSDIEKQISNINPRILSNRLKELEKAGFVSSHIKENTKNKTIYCLTKKGDDFSFIMKDIEKFIKKW